MAYSTVPQTGGFSPTLKAQQQKPVSTYYMNAGGYQQPMTGPQRELARATQMHATGQSSQGLVPMNSTPLGRGRSSPSPMQSDTYGLNQNTPTGVPSYNFPQAAPYQSPEPYPMPTTGGATYPGTTSTGTGNVDEINARYQKLYDSGQMNSAVYQDYLREIQQAGQAPASGQTPSQPSPVGGYQPSPSSPVSSVPQPPAPRPDPYSDSTAQLIESLFNTPAPTTAGSDGAGALEGLLPANGSGFNMNWQQPTGPQIPVGDFLSQQHIDSILNGAVAGNQTQSATDLASAGRNLASRGLSSNSPAFQSAANRIGLNEAIANTQARTQIPIQAARENADYRLGAMGANAQQRGLDINAISSMMNAQSGFLSPILSALVNLV